MTTNQQATKERTNEEILQRINALRESDFFGFQTGDLIARLPFEDAKQYLKPEVSADEWKEAPRDRESLLREMSEYMEFAWGKANDGRGISAARSMAHYAAWVWLAGDDLGDLNNYSYYGKDNLCRICAHYGWDSSLWDDGVREN